MIKALCVTSGNIRITPLIARMIRGIKRSTKKNKPTPPSPNNPTKRFKFFTGEQGKLYPPSVIHEEMQRYAFTPHGNKFLRDLKEQQAQKMREQRKSDMKILTPKKSIFAGLKNIIKKSQRGS